MKTRAWLACLALGVLCLTGSSPAEAREYPSKPITLVNPFGAGSSADIVVRLVEPFIKKAFGVNVIMSYKEGAGAVVGVNEFVTMRPDGYSRDILQSLRARAQSRLPRHGTHAVARCTGTALR